MNLYHNFGGDDDDWDDYMFLVDGDEVEARGERWNHKRIYWPLHVEKLLHEKMFDRTYRMSHAAFTYLCIILRPTLERNHAMSNEEDPITVEMTVGCGLRILSGGMQLDIKNNFGFSRTETHNTFIRFLDAVNGTVELDINLPSNPDEWNKQLQVPMNELFLHELCMHAWAIILEFQINIIKSCHIKPRIKEKSSRHNSSQALNNVVGKY